MFFTHKMLKFDPSTLKRRIMDHKKNDPTFDFEKKIYFSQTVKAGKRIYYLDVKKNKRDELFLSITESKKVYLGDTEEGQFNFEKHKIFLYREDFSKFIDALSKAIYYIHENSDSTPLPANETDSDSEPVESIVTDSEATVGDESVPDNPTEKNIDDFDLKIDF